MIWNWLRRKTVAPPTQGEPIGWNIIELRQHGALRYLISLRDPHPGRFPDPRKRFRVEIVWEGAWPGGFPDEQTTADQEEFEIHMEEYFYDEEFGDSVLARRVLGEGQKRWLCYSSDPDPLVSRVRNFFGLGGIEPVSIEVSEDPAWSDWSTTMSSYDQGD